MTISSISSLFSLKVFMMRPILNFWVHLKLVWDLKMLDMKASIYLCYSFPKRLSSGLCHDHHHQAVFAILKQGKRKPKSSSTFLFMLDNMCVHHPVYLFTACIRFLCCLAVKWVCFLKLCLKVVVHLRLKLIINSLFYYIEESYCLHS